MVGIVQLVRASDCGSECRGFESHYPPLKEESFIKRDSSFLGKYVRSLFYKKVSYIIYNNKTVYPEKNRRFRDTNRYFLFQILSSTHAFINWRAMLASSGKAGMFSRENHPPLFNSDSCIRISPLL